MSTQKQKFELFARLQALGFTYEESAQLRRIEMTLQRWSELECGDGNEWGSWAIERDEKTNKPFMVRHHYRHGAGKDTITRTPIADREAGALRRCKAIIDRRNATALAGLTPSTKALNTITAYHQTDPRGCALYLIKASDIPAGASIDSCYNRGLAVCA